MCDIVCEGREAEISISRSILTIDLDRLGGSYAHDIGKFNIGRNRTGFNRQGDFAEIVLVDSRHCSVATTIGADTGRYEVIGPIFRQLSERQRCTGLVHGFIDDSSRNSLGSRIVGKFSFDRVAELDIIAYQSVRTVGLELNRSIGRTPNLIVYIGDRIICIGSSRSAGCRILFSSNRSADLRRSVGQ